jgi:three-Cys-motif partner protein
MSMNPYLDPRPDGLLMRESGQWTAEKLDYVRRYLGIFETSMRGKWEVRQYIDLFAGPGKVCDRASGEVFLGSPLLALTAEFPFTHYYFVDKDEECMDALRQRYNASPHSDRVWSRDGDCNELVHSIVEKVRQHDDSSLGVAFLDPSGVGDLKWLTVEKLATVKRMDLILLYPEGPLNRAIPSCIAARSPTAVDDFFGGERWREIYGMHGHGGIPRRELTDLYRDNLRALGYLESAVEPLITNIARNAPMYRLLFASKHPLGPHFWDKITQRNVYGQLRFPLMSI